jgi:hypothetical protein
MSRVRLVLALVVPLAASPALAQQVQPGDTATVAGTQVGDRQTREQAAPGIQPNRRLATRVQNRVRSRIRNRIDAQYNPEADATTPFETAAEQANNAGRRAQQR